MGLDRSARPRRSGSAGTQGIETRRAGGARSGQPKEARKRSALLRVAYQPSYLVLDHTLDEVRQVGVEPFLQERPQHLAHHILDGPLSFAHGNVAHAFLAL